MIRTFKFRLYPSRVQQQVLEQTLQTCRLLYNNALAERKNAWEKEKCSIGYREQVNKLPELKYSNQYLLRVHSQVLQDVLRRLDKGFKAFFHRIKNGEKPGYPRFKSINRYDSFTYPQSGYVIRNKKLMLSKIGEINIKLHRSIEGIIKTCTIRRDIDRWYACFCAELPNTQIENRKIKSAVGIDVGLEKLITLSTGEMVAPPKFLKRSGERLIFEQRRLSHKKKGSRNRVKQRIRVARLHRKIRNQRADFNHKLSRSLVDNYDLIKFENLNIQGMLQNHYLAKSIADASWSQLINFTQYKAEEAGIVVEFVSAKGTSVNCNMCGHSVPKTLSQRIHVCPNCGCVEDRDVNAAKNILMAPSDGGEVLMEVSRLRTNEVGSSQLMR